MILKAFRILLQLGTLCLSVAAPAQMLDTLWARKFDGRGFDDLPVSIAASRDGRLIVSASLSLGYDIGEAGVLKLDSSGNPVRSKLFHRSHDDLSYGLVETADGGYLLTGTSASSENAPCRLPWKVGASINALIANECASVAGNVLYAGYAIRLDSLMDTVWARDYGVRIVSAKRALSGGGFLALLFRGGAGGTSDTVTLAGLSSDGSVSWETLVAGPALSVTHTALNKAGGLVVSGINRSTRASWIASYDSTGSLLWSRSDLGGGRVWSLWADTAGNVHQVVDQSVTESAVSAGELRRYSATGTHVVLGSVARLGGAPTGVHAIASDGSWLLLAVSGNVLHAGVQPPGGGAVRTSSWSVLNGLTGLVEVPRGSGVYYVLGSRPATPPNSFGNDLGVVKLALNPPPSFVRDQTEWRLAEEGVAVIGDTLRISDAFPGDIVQLTHVGAGSSAFTFNASARAFTWAPPREYFGDTSFTFVATDRIGQKDTLIYRIRVQNVNDTPSYALSFAGGVPRHAAFFGDTVRGVINGIDRDGDALRYRQLAPRSDFSVDSLTGAFTWIPAGKVAGPLQVRLEVSDGRLAVRGRHGFLISPGPYHDPAASVQYEGPGRDTITFRSGVQFIVDGTGGPWSNWDFSVGNVSWSETPVAVLQWSLTGTPDSLPDFLVFVRWGGFGPIEKVRVDPAPRASRDLDRDTLGFTAKIVTALMGRYAIYSGPGEATSIQDGRRKGPSWGPRLIRPLQGGGWELEFAAKVPDALRVSLFDAAGREKRVRWNAVNAGRVRLEVSGFNEESYFHQYLRIVSADGATTLPLHR